ncbi:MAG: MBOAT family protein [Eubacterium sp.]|nr:MBOAT family protein [Eubacterium sp.]
MYFSSMTFLWIFLPATLLLYLLAERFQRIALENFVLLSASLIFYAWGEPFYIFLLLFSVLMNYVFGRLLEAERPRFRKWILACGVLSNLGLLAFFKYFNFFAGYINRFLGQDAVPLSEFTLPLGISFYTFQAMSYVIDVYRKEVTAQRNFFSLLLYISLFPQLVAGPIVKYKDIEEQIKYRTKTDAKRAYGVKRFIYGLGKKVLISNVMGKYVDMVLAFETKQLSTGLMWLVMIMYAFQIYYDFSGYSDMAIGLGSMFGFDFKENFHYPYISKSVREFWTRWHISLSTWFKEYVYIPLGGNRNGKWRTYRNLFLVFLLTGFWHGAGLNFVFWGVFHGCFMVLERIGFGKLLEKNPFKVFNHIYMAVTVVCIWTFFRIESMQAAGEYLKGMFIYQRGEYNLFSCINLEIILLLVTAFLLCGVLQTAVPRLKEALYQKEKVSAVESVGLLAILLLCVVTLSSNSYNPFIYFRF